MFFESETENPMILKFLFLTSSTSSSFVYPMAKKGLEPAFFKIPDAIIGASECVSVLGNINNISGPLVSEKIGPKYCFSKTLTNLCNLDAANDTSAKDNSSSFQLFP